MKTLYFSATTKDACDKTILHDSLRDIKSKNKVYFALENKQPLAKVYNEVIDEALKTDFDCLVLVHDDVHIQHDPEPQLKRLFEKYDLIGVAGCSKVEIQTPALWHIMGQRAGVGNLHGAVAHGTPDKQQMTSFGQYPTRVLMIDGVFMALSRKVMENVRFDEDCPSEFHFYDLIYSYEAHLKGYRVGVGDIGIIHSSPGLREYTPEWTAGNDYFIKKYGK